MSDPERTSALILWRPPSFPSLSSLGSPSLQWLIAVAGEHALPPVDEEPSGSGDARLAPVPAHKADFKLNLSNATIDTAVVNPLTIPSSPVLTTFLCDLSKGLTINPYLTLLSPRAVLAPPLVPPLPPASLVPIEDEAPMEIIEGGHETTGYPLSPEDVEMEDMTDSGRGREDAPQVGNSPPSSLHEDHTPIKDLYAPVQPNPFMAINRFVLPPPPEPRLRSVSPVVSHRRASPASPTPAGERPPRLFPVDRLPPIKSLLATSRFTPAPSSVPSSVPSSLPSPSPSPEPELQEPAEPDVQPRNIIPKRQVRLAQKRKASSDDGDVWHEDERRLGGQWAVGKTPGHQGSHVRKPEVTDDQYDSTRVLKRPFRPPSRIPPLAPKKHFPPLSLTLSSPPSLIASGSGSGSSPTTTPGTMPTTPSTPATATTLAPGSASASARARQPFRPLSGPSSAVTPASKKRGFRDPDAALAAALQARLRTLRQAVRYVSSPDEDARIERLVRIWRNAGREVADRLFALLPPELVEVKPAFSHGGWDGSGGEGEGRKMDAQRGGGDSDRGDEDMSDEESEPAVVWDRGAMLLRLGVDPALLGFDADGDEWMEVDDE